MISTRDGAAPYLKTLPCVADQDRHRGRLRDARTSLSLYSKVTARSRAPRFAGRARRNTIPYQLAQEVES